jgi:hypothetical protein
MVGSWRVSYLGTQTNHDAYLHQPLSAMTNRRLRVARIYPAAWFVLLLLIGCAGGSSLQAPHEPSPDLLRSLFDGTSLGAWVPTNFGAHGDVRIVDSTLIIGFGDPLTGITWTGDFPTMNYEILLEAKRVDGADFFCGLTFPVRETFCSLIIGGWGGPLVGLSSLDGLDASENETQSIRRFAPNRWYAIRLRVANDSIRAWIDGEAVVNVSTEGREVSIRPEVLPSRPLGIASYQTTAALRRLYVQILGE